MRTSEYVNYFREAARSNRILRHKMTPDRETFRRMNIDEILNAQKTDLADISMVLENFEKRAQDMFSDNRRKLITGAFLIIKEVEEGNFDAEVEALDETEAVTEQLLAKISNDVAKYSMDKTHPWALKGFDPNSVKVGSVHGLFGNWHGWRVMFTINQTWANNLVLQDEDWLNDTKFSI